MIKNKVGRGAKLLKCYIALFICFATKALHLEVVSDLSADSFLSTFKRFVARRGRPLEVFSDNGKNFVGAHSELKAITQFFRENQEQIIDASNLEGIKWNFNPAYAPHFGGLWEAGVKATKYHLKRVIGEIHLTYEEFLTTLIQIEAILNSRPLTPMSPDPLDFQPLTPGHFLIGRPLTSLPERDLTNISTSRLSRYQLLEQIRQHFWNRWKNEYVSELQTKTKWKVNQGQLRENTMVIIKDDHLPPLKWSIGRIVNIFPGRDGVSRVASIQTSKGLIKRAFSKIVPLPFNNQPEFNNQPNVERDFQGGGHVLALSSTLYAKPQAVPTNQE